MTSEAPADIPGGERAPLSHQQSRGYEDERLIDLDAEEGATQFLDALVPLIGIAALVTAVLIVVVVSAIAKSVLSFASR